MGRVIFISYRAFRRKPSLTYLNRNENITAVYSWDQLYRNILMNMKFAGRDHMKDLEFYAKEANVKWNKKDLSRGEMKRLRNRMGLVVYSP